MCVAAAAMIGEVRLAGVVVSVAVAACGGFDEAASTGSSDPTVANDDGATAEATGEASGSSATATAATGGSAGGVDTSTSGQDSTDGAVADETTDGGAGSTGAMVGHDGQYAGTISGTFNVPNIGQIPCSGNASISVVMAGAPMVTGMGNCDAFIPGIGALTISGVIVGDVVSPDASGTLTITASIGGVMNEGPWVGAFAGDAFDASFNGSVVVEGIPVDYAGTWTTLR